jgi:hypothetical protein
VILSPRGKERHPKCRFGSNRRARAVVPRRFSATFSAVTRRSGEMADATDLKLRFLRFLCLSKSIKSNAIHLGKSTKSRFFAAHERGEQKAAHLAQILHTRVEGFQVRVRSSSGSSPVGSAVFAQRISRYEVRITLQTSFCPQHWKN